MTTAADGSTITRKAFQHQINQLGHALLTQGVKTGDRVAVQVEKSPQAFALYCAVVKIGAVFLPLNTGYTISELDYFIGDAEPSVVVADPAIADNLAAQINRSEISFLTLDENGAGSLMDMADGQSTNLDPTPRGEDDCRHSLYIRHNRPVKRHNAQP